MSWAIGYVQKPDSEFQVFRYESFRRAAVNLTQLLAEPGLSGYEFKDIMACMTFLSELEKAKEEDFEENGKEIWHLQLENFMFVIGKYEAFTRPSEATYKVVQDHRKCTPTHCFGDIAEQN